MSTILGTSSSTFQLLELMRHYLHNFISNVNLSMKQALKAFMILI